MCDFNHATTVRFRERAGRLRSGPCLGMRGALRPQAAGTVKAAVA